MEEISAFEALYALVCALILGAAFIAALLYAAMEARRTRRRSTKNSWYYGEGGKPGSYAACWCPGPCWNEHRQKENRKEL